jgi:hypothetical protein
MRLLDDFERIEIRDKGIDSTKSRGFVILIDMIDDRER